MSKEAKNEIDLMLRQLGRRDGSAYGGATHGTEHSGEQHLDADELNSYVANALPAAARNRYMEHLADCASCRRLVAQLSAAQGTVVAQQAGTVPAPSVLRQFLASLFSPMVLRYAVPALGVIVIMVVGFVVMRRESAPESLARLIEREQKSAAVAASPSPETTLDGLVKQDDLRPAESPAPKASPLHGDSSGFADDSRAEPPSAAPVTANEPRATTPEVHVYDSTAKALPAPKVAATTEADETERRGDREKKADVDKQPPAKLGEVTVKQREEQNKAAEPQRAKIAQSGPATGLAGINAVKRREASPKDAREDVRDEAADKDDAVKEKNEAGGETRSVAGRRFRKKDNVWIDTAYSSQQTFTYSRNSEQYRALVGDEPEIRQIAEQLDGEFIVVWKGRAYRIR